MNHGRIRATSGRERENVGPDENGYLVRIDVHLRPLPQHPRVFDARSAFIDRYLKHAHHWQPSQQLIEHALDLISAARTGQSTRS